MKLFEVSNVAVIFYDFQKPNTFLKLKQEILPLALTYDNLYSVIVVGNKFDLLDANNQKFAAEQDKEEILKSQIEEKVLNCYY
jgi:GTPase SAR1 family protein